jgi:hypothetical protein
VQKLAPLNKWKKGVHQLLLWVGYSRPSKKSEKKGRPGGAGNGGAVGEEDFF